jgi:glycosyltransferase involved in cell wall biosynthesis
MRIVTDGDVYSWQRSGGVSNYFNQILPRVARCPGTAVDLILPAILRGAPPRAPRIAQYKNRTPPSLSWLSWRLDHWVARAWNKVEKSRWNLRYHRASDAVFHSTYFTPSPCGSLPEILTVYDMVYERFPDLFNNPWDDEFRARKRDCIQRATRIIAISQHTKNDVCELFEIPPAKVEVTHLGVDGTKFFPDEGAEEKVRQKYGLAGPYLLYVGERFHYKNYNRLVEAFAKSRLSRTTTLVLAGRPLAEDERDSLHALGVAERTRVIPFPGVVDLRMLYQAAAVFVYPSLYEGFGLPLLEAMACGAPVAAARAGSIPEVGGDVACYFDPYDRSDMVSAIEHLLGPKTAAQYRRRGLERVRAFSWDHTAAQTMAVYRSALAAAGRPLPPR